MMTSIYKIPFPVQEPEVRLHPVPLRRLEHRLAGGFSQWWLCLHQSVLYGN